jgi:CheY-like chemotaxis protein
MAAGVLVVDDDSAFRALAIRLLRSAGVRVSGEADTVRGAMEAALELRPAGILLDVGLPDGDGIEASRELAALPWRPRVVLTSSDPEIDRSDRLDGSGAAAFIAKQDLTASVLGRFLALD